MSPRIVRDLALATSLRHPLRCLDVSLSSRLGIEDHSIAVGFRCASVQRAVTKPARPPLVSGSGCWGTPAAPPPWSAGPPMTRGGHWLSAILDQVKERDPNGLAPYAANSFRAVRDANYCASPISPCAFC